MPAISRRMGVDRKAVRTALVEVGIIPANLDRDAKAGGADCRTAVRQNV
jgi:hypothetical protein